jgi:hypothetical protein
MAYNARLKRVSTRAQLEIKAEGVMDGDWTEEEDAVEQAAERKGGLERAGRKALWRHRWRRVIAVNGE